MRSFTSILIGIITLVLLILLGTVIATDKAIHHLQEQHMLANFDGNLTLLQLYTDAASSALPTYDQVNTHLEAARKKNSDTEFQLKREEVSKGSLLLSEYFLNFYRKKEITQAQKKEAVLRCVNTYKIAALHQHLKIPPEKEKLISKIRNIYSIQNVNYEWEKNSAELMHTLSIDVPKLRARVNSAYH